MRLNFVFTHGIGLSAQDRECYASAWRTVLEEHGVSTGLHIDVRWESFAPAPLNAARLIVDPGYRQAAVKTTREALVHASRHFGTTPAGHIDAVLVGHSYGCVLQALALADLPCAQYRGVVHLGGPQASPFFERFIRATSGRIRLDPRNAHLSYFFYNNDDAVTRFMWSTEKVGTYDVMTRVALPDERGTKSIFREHHDLSYLSHPLVISALKEM